MKKKAFTLFEIVLAISIFSLIAWIIFHMYINTKKSEKIILNQQLLLSETNNFLDQISDLSLDYTIDYEEYFNRGVLWCSLNVEEFSRQKSWCDLFTHYWNAWSLYYCSNEDWAQSGYNYYPLSDYNWCVQSWEQAFLQYKYQFWNIADSTLNNWNDIFLWTWPLAVYDHTWIQELYLINKDWDHRVFFRRKYLTWVDLDWDWSFTWKNESQYTIQILKLKWFDIWTGHNYDPDLFVENWFIDTWACDYDNWFICSWEAIWSWLFSWYKLPIDSNDGWVDLINSKITISDRNIEVWPAKDPNLAINEAEYLLDPYIKINLIANIYWYDSNEEITLQTSIWFKNSYFNRKEVNYTGFLP